MVQISVIIPALNEASALADTLASLRTAFASLPAPELLVVDNGSTDDTAAVARAHGARVVSEPVRGAGRARNAGARAATGDFLVFLDADTRVPPDFAVAVTGCSNDASCLGGAFDTDQRPRRAVLRAYLALWRLIGLTFGMAQGAAQFCRRQAFDELRGYDERLYMGEDVDFYWRLTRFARKRGAHTTLVRNVRVVPSHRRFDAWPLWRTLVFTNPAVVALLGRRKAIWRGWHETPPR